MKNRIFSLIVMFFVIGTVTVFAQSKTEEIKVYGSCGMCKSRIEKAAKAVDGVTSAEWNGDTEMLTVTYESSETDTEKIEKAVAKVGHDTDSCKADDEVYNNLPGCCKYDRPKSKE